MKCYVWVKWCSEWSDIFVSFPDILLLLIFFKYSLQFLPSFLPSFLILTSLHLHNCTSKNLLFHLIILSHTTVFRTSPDKWSAQRTPLYPTTHTPIPQFQKSSRPKPTPQTAQSPGSAFPLIVCLTELQLIWFCVTQIGYLVTVCRGSGGESPLILNLDTKRNVETRTVVVIVTAVNSGTRPTAVDISIFLCAHLNITVATYPALI